MSKGRSHSIVVNIEEPPKTPKEPLQRDPVVTSTEWLPARYRFVRDLSTGRSARVSCVLDTVTDDLVAVKLVDTDTLNESQLARLEGEIAIMGALDHPGCVRLLDTYRAPGSILIVMEYVSGGDLLQYLWSRPDYRLSMEEAAAIFVQIAQVLDHMHQRGFVHRDIKPENILLEANGTVKVADFGFACSWSPSARRNSSVGTIYYAAPEIVTRGCTYHGPEVDVWSLGVTLFAMVNGYLPFHGENNSATRRLIRAGLMPPFSSQPPDVLVRLVQDMLAVEQRSRPTMADVLLNPWVVQGIADWESRRNYRGRSRSVGTMGESKSITEAIVGEVFFFFFFRSCIFFFPSLSFLFFFFWSFMFSRQFSGSCPCPNCMRFFLFFFLLVLTPVLAQARRQVASASAYLACDGMAQFPLELALQHVQLGCDRPLRRDQPQRWIRVRVGNTQVEPQQSAAPYVDYGIIYISFISGLGRGTLAPVRPAPAQSTACGPSTS